MQKVECHQCRGMYFKVSRSGRGAESCGVSRVECDRGLSEFQRLVLEDRYQSQNECPLTIVPQLNKQLVLYIYYYIWKTLNFTPI